MCWLEEMVFHFIARLIIFMYDTLQTDVLEMQ